MKCNHILQKWVFPAYVHSQGQDTVKKYYETLILKGRKALHTHRMVHLQLAVVPAAKDKLVKVKRYS